MKTILKKILLIVLTGAMWMGCSSDSDSNSNSSPTYDVNTKGIPQFVTHDFTQLDKITEISMFRSGYGHDYSDDFESCRSMKHYYAPYSPQYANNNEIEIYAPVNGKIHSIENEGHGESNGLENKQIRIVPDGYPAFMLTIFHTDLVSADIVSGKTVSAGELIGHARMVYPDLSETAHDFDIAVSVNTPQGRKLVSFFNTMSDTVFNSYMLRGANERNDFIISKEDRDVDALTCDADHQFLTSGSLINWRTLN